MKSLICLLLATVLLLSLYSLISFSGLSITSAVEIPINKPLIPPPVAIAPKLTFTTSTLLTSESYVKAYVDEAAMSYGVNLTVVDWILSHESQNGQNLTGDDGNSRGYWQISNIYHPEVSDECAMDLDCSTAWAMKHILAGKVNEWSSWKYRCKWYANAPSC